jgi:hypothetical protein
MRLYGPQGLDVPEFHSELLELLETFRAGPPPAQ